MREGYICIGWDEVGDLSKFESKEAFRARFEDAYPYNGLLAQARRKGNELWALTELENPQSSTSTVNSTRPRAITGQQRSGMHAFRTSSCPAPVC